MVLAAAETQLKGELVNCKIDLKKSSKGNGKEEREKEGGGKREEEGDGGQEREKEREEG